MDKLDSKEEWREAEDKPREASRALLREAISSCGLNNFENALNAIEEFLSKIELFDPNVAFGEAANMFLRAALAFALLDDNRDNQLSRRELAEHAANADETIRATLEFLLLHYESVRKARLFHHHDTLSRRDLLAAAELFTAMEYIHHNFDKIASLHGTERPNLTHQDILIYMWRSGKGLPAGVRPGLQRFARYLQQLEREGTNGIDEDDLNSLTPESIWHG